MSSREYKEGYRPTLQLVGQELYLQFIPACLPERNAYHSDSFYQGTHKTEHLRDTPFLRSVCPAPPQQCCRGRAGAFTTKEDGGHTLLTKAGTQGTNSHLDKYSVIPTLSSSVWF